MMTQGWGTGNNEGSWGTQGCDSEWGGRGPQMCVWCAVPEVAGDTMWGGVHEGCMRGRGGWRRER